MTSKQINDYSNYFTTTVGDEFTSLSALEANHVELQNQLSGLLPEDRHAAICEIGCGFGRNLMSLQRMGYTNLSGVDISSEQVAIARNRFGLGFVEEGSASEFLEKEKEYRLILLFDLLEHMPVNETIILLRQASRRLLGSGGTILIRVPNSNCPLNSYFGGDVTHITSYNPLSIKQMVKMTALVGTVAVKPIHPAVRGLKGGLRALIWRVLVNPLISVFALIIYGRFASGIHTPNLLCKIDIGPSSHVENGPQ